MTVSVHSGRPYTLRKLLLSITISGYPGPTRSLYLGSLNQAEAELSSAESSTNAQQRRPHTQQTSLVARCAETADGGLAVLPLFHIFNDFCQTDYLNTHRTNIRQIFRVGKTTAVDDQYEILVFRSLRDVAMATNCWLASSTQLSSCENCATCTMRQAVTCCVSERKDSIHMRRV